MTELPFPEGRTVSFQRLSLEILLHDLTLQSTELPRQWDDLPISQLSSMPLVSTLLYLTDVLIPNLPKSLSFLFSNTTVQALAFIGTLNLFVYSVYPAVGWVMVKDRTAIKQCNATNIKTRCTQNLYRSRGSFQVQVCHFAPSP